MYIYMQYKIYKYTYIYVSEWYINFPIFRIFLRAAKKKTVHFQPVQHEDQAQYALGAVDVVPGF